jgi:hypothetical protein
MFRYVSPKVYRMFRYIKNAYISGVLKQKIAVMYFLTKIVITYLTIHYGIVVCLDMKSPI